MSAVLCKTQYKHWYQKRFQAARCDPEIQVPKALGLERPFRCSWAQYTVDKSRRHNHSMARTHHTAWTPPSLPDSIVLLGGFYSAAPLTAEIVPGI